MATYHLSISHNQSSPLDTCMVKECRCIIHCSTESSLKKYYWRVKYCWKKNVRQREGTHMSDNFEKLIFWKFTGSTWLIILKIKTILIQNKERNKGKLENNMTLILNWICFGHKTWKFSFSIFIIGSYLLKLLFLQDF